MSRRQKVSATEIERRCLETLQRSMGLRDTKSVGIRPYTGNKGFSWELDLDKVEPKPGPIALAEAMPAIHALQQQFDLGN